jgi:hypothetical protein
MNKSHKPKEKKIGEGYEGDVYLIHENKQLMIKKILRIPEEALNPSTQYSIWRQVEFNEFAKQYPNYFTILQKFTIDQKCSYQKQKPKWIIDQKEIEKWNHIQTSPVCAILYYTPVLSGTLNDLYKYFNEKYKRKKISAKKFYQSGFQLMFQRLYILNLMLEHGWTHNDAHGQNWLYKKSNSILHFGKYHFKCPFHLYLSDYGSIVHKTHHHIKDQKIHFKSQKYNDMVLNIADNIDDPMIEMFEIEMKQGNQILVAKPLYRALKRSPLAKTIHIPKHKNQFVNEIAFVSLFKMKYYKEYNEIRGFDVIKYKDKLMKFDDWEYDIYYTLFKYVMKPIHLFEFLIKLCI